MSAEQALDEFVARVSRERGIELYAAQQEALLAVALGDHVILSTPTGSGKSLVALGAHTIALDNHHRTAYTAPIKALVSEKFFDLVAEFGAEQVGMITGDVSINPDAPVLCCTAEILANIALRNADARGITQVVMDEFHYYADPERGWAWQVPLLLMHDAQFVLMSATLGDVTEIAMDLERRTARQVSEVTGVERPVPLDFRYAVAPVHEVIEQLRDDGELPAYVVHFNQAHAVEQAQALASARVADREHRDRIQASIGSFRFSTGFGTTLSRLLRAGIGVHHAGMLPRYRRLVEQLAQQGLLRVICGTDTLGVGINVPIRTVVITALAKFDGEKMRRLSAREFHQVAGRAGRAGYDREGDVVVLAPEHEIENAKAEAKAAARAAASRGTGGGKGPKKPAKKSAPQGFVNWSSQTFEKLQVTEPEALVSQMQVSHSMVLGVIERGEGHPGAALETMRTLVFDSHEPRRSQFDHARRALGIFRTLRRAGVVEVIDGQPRLTDTVQRNFALNQPLSPFALAAFELLDPESESYALDVISIVEATLEDPRAILRAQEHRARGEAVAAMKAEGLEYDERMERLEHITHPRPLAELIEAAFESYVAEVPWARDSEPRPKSVIREMVERAFGFRDLVTVYQLGRAEGSVLRYLSDAYRALAQTVPESKRDDPLNDIIAWLGETVRQIDSSLIDEWEALGEVSTEVHGSAVSEVSLGDANTGESAPDITAQRSVLQNERAFTIMIRNALWRRVEAAAFERTRQLGEWDGPHGFSERDWNEALDRYFQEYDEIRIDAEARSSAYFEVSRAGAGGADHAIRQRNEPEASPRADKSGSRDWQVRQILLDPEGNRDWAIHARVDLSESEAVGDAVIVIEKVGPFS